MAVTVTMILVITDCLLTVPGMVLSAKCLAYALTVTHYCELGVIVTRPTLQKSSLRLGIARSWPRVIQASAWYSQGSGVSASCKMRRTQQWEGSLHHGGRAKVRQVLGWGA